MDGIMVSVGCFDGGLVGCGWVGCDWLAWIVAATMVWMALTAMVGVGTSGVTVGRMPIARLKFISAPKPMHTTQRMDTPISR